MQIEYNGEMMDAYALVMRREFADAIYRGEKRIELRAASPFYDRLFLDKEKMKEYEKDPDNEDIPFPFKDIFAVHFYSTGAPWTLDCLVEAIGMASLTEADVKFLQDEYGIHELDEDLESFADVPEEERPDFYYLIIEKIIGSKRL